MKATHWASRLYQLVRILTRPILLFCGLICLPVAAQSEWGVVPKPVQFEALQGRFELTGDVTVRTVPQLAGARDALRLLLGPATDFDFASAGNEPAGISFVFDDELGPEAYELHVGEAGVRILASSEAGAFYALQTLRQLLPVDIFRDAPVQRGWSVPAVRIADAPRFTWRGMHLDVGRHFMPVAFVKKFIDVLALHKFNTFHWHLTEDQGWRIEIKRYPLLTEVGSVRAQTVIGNPMFKDADELEYDGTPHGGFYTQEEVREVVAYAARRHITVVPEIEFPGHAGAAIAAYPELGNTGEQLQVMQTWGINKNTLKPSDYTLQFYRNVLEEVIALFPSHYIHIGGDEAPKDQWEQSDFAQQRIAQLGLADEHELQSWMIREMETYLAANDRRLIGWDEIMEGGLSATASVMSWRGVKPGLRAARAGHDVVMAPTRWTYFDYYQADPGEEPLAIGSYLPLADVYAFDPAPEHLGPQVRQHILGAQGQLWTEYMPVPEHVEYMAFPRAVALSEVVWSPQAVRDYGDFERRLAGHLDRLTVLGVNYRPPGNDRQSLINRVRTAFTRTAMSVYFWLQEP